MAKTDQTDKPDTAMSVPTDYGSPLTGNDAWWDEQADEVEGYDLLKDKVLFSIVGVPFKVFTLTYRPGIQQKGCEWRNDYVSAELRVAPPPIIIAQYARIQTRRSGSLIQDPRAIPSPGEQLVVNDGSTGFYRQSVEYLESKELITVPEADHAGNALPKGGKKNECRYDLPASYWELNDDAIRAGNIETRYTPTGELLTIFRVRLNCNRGLRYSDYDNPTGAGEDAVTFYIA